MTETLPSALDELVDRFFRGNPPSIYDLETLKGAMARQIVHCHALIHHEMSEALELEEEPDPLESFGDRREGAYGRIASLTSLIADMTAVIEPRPEQGPPEKRHALRIEVNRTAAPPADLARPALAIDPAAAAEAEFRRRRDNPELALAEGADAFPTPPEHKGRRWPREAYFDGEGRFFNPMCHLHTHHGYDLTRLRAYFGFPPFQGGPLPRQS